jgi:hypothetical protein
MVEWKRRRFMAEFRNEQSTHKAHRREKRKSDSYVHVNGISGLFPLIVIISVFVIAISPLTISCSGEMLTPTNPSAKYAANITGNVIITNSLQASTSYTRFNNESMQRIWIVNVTFTNRGYNNPEIRSYYYWTLVPGNNYPLWDWKIEAFPLLFVPLNQTAECVLGFLVPTSARIDDTWLRYENDKIISFGRLIGGQVVQGYDWETKTVLNHGATPYFSPVP